MGLGIGLSFGGSRKNEEAKSEKWSEQSGTTSAQQTGQTSGWGNSQSSFWTPEQQGLASKLAGMLGGSWGASPAQQTGTAALTRAATGTGYQNIIDPRASNELYAAIEKQTLEDILPKATGAIAKEANLAGMLRSGPALQMQLDSRNQIVNQLMQTLSGLKYQDETQRRQIEQEREGRQAGAGQALIASDPQQQQIQNILSMLGIRGATQETTQQGATSEQQSIENIVRDLYERVKQKGNTNTGSFGLGGSFS